MILLSFRCLSCRRPHCATPDAATLDCPFCGGRVIEVQPSTREAGDVAA